MRTPKNIAKIGMLIAFVAVPFAAMPPASAAPNAAVAIQGFDFNPGVTVVADIGGPATITFVNLDPVGVNHDVRSVTFIGQFAIFSPPGLECFNPIAVAGGGGVVSTTVKPSCDGVIDYICTIHYIQGVGGMRGAVLQL